MSETLTPLYREEFYLAKLAGEDVTIPTPLYRTEKYLAKLCGEDVAIPEPIYREEKYLAKLCGEDVDTPAPLYRVEYWLAALCGEDVVVPDPYHRIEYFLDGWLNASPSATLLTVTGAAPLSLPRAAARDIHSLIQYGKVAQASTPTPSSPVDIKCNNGALTMVDDELPVGYRRVLGYQCNNNAMWRISDFHLRGSDTVRISFSITAACNVWGCYQAADATDNYDLYVSTTSGSKYLRYGSGTYASAWSADDLGERFDCVYTPTGTSGMPVDSTWTEKTFEAANDLLIGSTTLTGSSAKLKGNLYGDIIVDGRLHLIPCERESDNVLGYYDTYGETFYEPYTGYAGAVSLGYDGSHYQQTVVGTPEVLTISASGEEDKTASVSDLLAVDTAVDEQDIISGAITRKCGVYIFDGTEAFGSSSAYGAALYIQSFSTRIRADKSVQPICSHFVAGAATGTQPEGTCFFNASGHFYFRTSDSATDFKQWLKDQYAAGTPVMIVFALATATTDSVTAQPLATASGTNTVSIMAEVSGIDLKAEYYGTEEE